MIHTLTAALQDHLGWETGQHGDAVCFFTVAYCNRDHDIMTR